MVPRSWEVSVLTSVLHKRKLGTDTRWAGGPRFTSGSPCLQSLWVYYMAFSISLGGGGWREGGEKEREKGEEEGEEFSLPREFCRGQRNGILSLCHSNRGHRWSQKSLHHSGKNNVLLLLRLRPGRARSQFTSYCGKGLAL